MSDEMLSTILNEIKEMKENMVMKADISNMATKEDVAEIPFIKATVHELSAKVDVIEKEMVKKVDLDYVYQKIAVHDREIFNLTRHA